MSLDPHGRFLLTGIARRGLPDHFFEPIDRLEFGKEAVALFLSSGHDIMQLAPLQLRDVLREGHPAVDDDR